MKDIYDQYSSWTNKIGSNITIKWSNDFNDDLIEVFWICISLSRIYFAKTIIKSNYSYYFKYALPKVIGLSNNSGEIFFTQNLVL